MPTNDKPVVLIVEDEEQHFRAIADNLGEYHCVHVNVGDFANMASIVRKWRPVAAVVDILLYTAGVEQADQELKAYLEWLEDLVIKGVRKPGPKFDSKIECKSGADCIPIIRTGSPGVKIVICSKEFGGDKPSSIDAVAASSGADAAIAKQFHPYPTLANAEAIAEKVRRLIA